MPFLTLTLHPAIDRVVRVARWQPAGTFEGRLVCAYPAGKGVNTARSLRGLLGPKARIAAAAWLGAGEAAWFRTQLAKKGIRLHAIPRACSTRVCLTLLEADGKETHLKESMPPPARAEELELARSVSKLPARGIVAVCGSAPPKTRRSVLAQVLRELRRRSRFLIADTNGPFLLEAVRAGLNGVKGNAAEIAAWLGQARPLDPHRTKDRARLRTALEARGAPKAVLVTLGEGGAMLARHEGIWYTSAPMLKVRKAATGCGDAATAGWLWALSEGCGPEETLIRAVACGTAKLASADPGGLSAQRVAQLRNKVKPKKLE